MTARPRGAADPMWLGWLSLLVPLLTIHAAYLISAWAGHVPWCVPHLEGCTSISRAVREDPARLLFRAVMLPACAILLFHWWACLRWLRRQAPASVALRRAMLTAGVIGAISLAAYTLYVGDEGRAATALRDYGGFVFAAFTALGHGLLAGAVGGDRRLPAGPRHGLVALCVAMLLLALLVLPIQSFVPQRYAAVSAIQWVFTVLMLACFPLTTALFRHTGFAFFPARRRQPAPPASAGSRPLKGAGARRAR